MSSPDPQKLAAKIERFEGMVAQFPSSEVPRFSLAQAYMDADRLDEADAMLQSVIEIKADFMMAWILRGRALMGLERFEDARAVVTEALALAKAQDHRDPQIDCELMLEELEEILS